MEASIVTGNVTENLETVGQCLRQARKSHRVSDIEKISDELCIRRHMLVALERDDFNAFPSACYATGFLKVYAKYLGLDVNRISTQYRNEFCGADEQVVLVFPEGEARRDYTLSIVVSLVVLTLVVLYGLWFSVGKNKLTSANLLPDMADVASTILASNMTSQPEDDLAQEAVYIPAAASEEPEKEFLNEKILPNEKMALNEKTPLKKGNAFTLVQQASANTHDHDIQATAIMSEKIRLIAGQNVWVRIVGPEGDVLVDRIMLEGEEFYAPDRKGLNLMTSNAAALKIHVGDLPVSSLGAYGQIRNDIMLDRDSLLSPQDQTAALITH